MASGTFSATGTSSSVYVFGPSHTAKVVISNTFVATVWLERKFSSGWQQILAMTAGVTVTLPIATPDTYRLNCTDYTSGTVTYALTSQPAYQIEVRGPDGSLSLGVDADGSGTVNRTTLGATVAAAVVGTALNVGVEDALVALVGGGQSGATALSAACGVHRVGTVATAADSVALPASSTGALHVVVNGAANSMQVFGTTPDTINDVATGTGVAQAGGKSATYFCPVVGKWYRVLSA